jgi:4-amino-4-deoxy-L-arabinose transferase-like glycosyltransferase
MINPESRVMAWAERHRYFLVLAFSLLLSGFLRLPYFQYDFIFIDEAWWANGANVLHQGGRLYVDIALDKNPLIFWFCAALFRLFGVSMTSIHVGVLLLVCATSVLLYLVGSRFFSKGVGAAAALVHAVASTTYYIPRIIGMNTETLMVFFSTGSCFFYLLALEQKKQSWFFLAGFLSAVAFLTKPVAGTEIALLLLFLFAGGNRKNPISALVLVSGFALVLALFGAYLYFSGILVAWWDQTILYGFRYVARIGLGTFLSKSIRVAGAFACIFAWLFILILLSRRQKNGNARAYVFLVCWLCASFIGIVAGRRYYANYFIQAIPPLSMLGGIGLNYLWNNRRHPGLRLIRNICGAVFLLSFVWFHSRTIASWCSLAFPALRDIKIWDMWSETARNREIAGYIRSRSPQDARIFVWGAKSQLFFLAQRRPPDRWLDYEVADDYPPGSALPETRLQAAQVLHKVKPIFIVDVERVARIDKFPEFRGLLEHLYLFDSEIAGARLYRLQETP